MALAKSRPQGPTPLVVGKEVTGTVTLFITNAAAISGQR
jgi:hypothetical protein